VHLISRIGGEDRNLRASHGIDPLNAADGAYTEQSFERCIRNCGPGSRPTDALAGDRPQPAGRRRREARSDARAPRPRRDPLVAASSREPVGSGRRGARLIEPARQGRVGRQRLARAFRGAASDWEMKRPSSPESAAKEWNLRTSDTNGAERRLAYLQGIHHCSSASTALLKIVVSPVRARVSPLRAPESRMAPRFSSPCGVHGEPESPVHETVVVSPGRVRVPATPECLQNRPRWPRDLPSAVMVETAHRPFPASSVDSPRRRHPRDVVRTGPHDDAKSVMLNASISATAASPRGLTSNRRHGRTGADASNDADVGGGGEHSRLWS
jgi:hypothetical protein